MNWTEGLRIAGGVLAMGYGFVAYCVTLFAQAAPAVPEIANPSSALATGAVYTGVAGILLSASTFVSSIIKPYLEDRQKKRESEERKLRMQFGVKRNNQMALLHQRWIEEACKINPELPKSPAWITLFETSESEEDRP